MTQGLILLHQMVGDTSCRRNSSFIQYLCLDPWGNILSGHFQSQFEFLLAETPFLFLIASLHAQLKNGLDFSKTNFKTFCQILRLLRKSKPFLLVCGGPFLIILGDKYSDSGVLIPVPLFPCRLITVAARCPKADASPANCQERKKTHLHWLLYLKWFLKPSKKTTVILASKQLKVQVLAVCRAPEST